MERLAVGEACFKSAIVRAQLNYRHFRCRRLPSTAISEKRVRRWPFMMDGSAVKRVGPLRPSGIQLRSCGFGQES